MPDTRPETRVKRYADLTGNRKRVRIKSRTDNNEAIEYCSDVILGMQVSGLSDGTSESIKTDNKTKIEEEKQKLVRNVEVVVLKNRNGKTGGRVQLKYDAKFNYLRKAPKQPQ